MRYVWDNFELLLPITEERMKFSTFPLEISYYWSFMARPGRRAITLKSVYWLICFHLNCLYSQSFEGLLFSPNCLVLNWSPDISHLFKTGERKWDEIKWGRSIDRITFPSFFALVPYTRKSLNPFQKGVYEMILTNWFLSTFLYINTMAYIDNKF